MNRYFLSHAHEDKKFAQKLRKDILLIDNAHLVFMDQYDLHAGDSLTTNLKQQINESNYFILVYSEHSIMSEWVQYELENARKSEQLTGQKKIFIVIPPGSNVSVPQEFSHQVIFRFNDSSTYTSDFHKLMYGMSLKPSFYKVQHSVKNDPEYGYLFDIWVEAEQPEYKKKINLVEYRFDYEFGLEGYNINGDEDNDPPLEGAVHREESAKNNFKIKNGWTDQSIVVLVCICLKNTKMIYIVVHIDVGNTL